MTNNLSGEMLEGSSALALPRALHGWRTSASGSSGSSSRGFRESHPIFAPLRAGAGFGIPTASGGALLARAQEPPDPPGAGACRAGADRRGASRTRSCRRRRGAAGARAPGGDLSAPRKGRRRGGPRPGYWPRADPPLRAPVRSPALAALGPKSGVVCAPPILFKELSAATCGGSRSAPGWNRAGCTWVWEWAWEWEEESPRV